MINPEIVRRGESTPAEVLARFGTWSAGEPAPKRPSRIALGMTLLDKVESEIFLRWINLLRSHWWPGPLYHSRDMYVTQARNLVLRDALKEKEWWDALLFWDADQMPAIAVPGPLPWQAASGEFWPGGFLTDYLDWLVINEPHKKVIGGLYFSKEAHIEVAQDGKLIHAPHDPVAYFSPPDSGGYRPLTEVELIPMLERRGLYKVDAVGTGAMLIRKEIIERMAERKGGDIFEAPPVREMAGQIPGSQWTEDTYFCEQVRKDLGESIWLDTADESAHLRKDMVTSGTYLEKRGYLPVPQEQTSKALIEKARMERAEEKRDRKRESRIWVPGR